MLRVLKILEMAWLLIGLFSMIMGAYEFNQTGWTHSKWFFGGALIAGVFFAFRRRQRLKFEQSEKQQENKDK
ncbi:MAG: hypothetical protein K9J17_18110 [Flavobacteriales bacterium]|nr:hypothetical protein [Flavobacteriales bacterium]